MKNIPALLVIGLLAMTRPEATAGESPVSQRYCDAQTASDLRFATDFMAFAVNLGLDLRGEGIPMSVLDKYLEHNDFWTAFTIDDKITLTHTGGTQNVISYPTDLKIEFDENDIVRRLSFEKRECVMDENIGDFENWLIETYAFYSDKPDDRMSGDFFARAVIGQSASARAMAEIIEACNCLRRTDVSLIYKLQYGENVDIHIPFKYFPAFFGYAAISPRLEYLDDGTVKAKGGGLPTVLNASRGPWYLDSNSLVFEKRKNKFLPYIEFKTR